MNGDVHFDALDSNVSEAGYTIPLFLPLCVPGPRLSTLQPQPFSVHEDHLNRHLRIPPSSQHVSVATSFCLSPPRTRPSMTGVKQGIRFVVVFLEKCECVFGL